MLGPAVIPIALLVVIIVCILWLVIKPGLTISVAGKIYAFLFLFIFPVFALLTGTNQHMEKSKTTAFCLSCHEMKPYGKSLHVDDSEWVPASHFQNKRVPQESACFTCHTDYTLFGDLKAKIRGLRHVYVHYVSSPPKQIRLYSPYNNRECLHCHGGARSFEEGATHNDEPTRLALIKSNRLSCLSAGCHEIAHNIGELQKASLWKEPVQ